MSKSDKLDLPWKEPEGRYSHYADDGPEETVEFEIDGHRMRVGPAGALAPTTMRTRYRVECLSCGVLVHRATTGATRRVEQHIA